MDLDHVTSGSLIGPTQLKRFLGANRWSIIEDRDHEWEIWRAPEEVEATSVTLIFDDEYFDYDTRLFEANQAIQRAYSIDAVGLAERITSLSADLFFFRIDQFSRDGTISFKQAQRALDGISTMVRAAATTTASPQHSHKGRRPAEVESFLAENLRLGHTKKGSFVVTAVARFDDADDVQQGGTVGEVNGVSVDPVVPFGRRVMATLSRGLSAARSVATDEIAVGTAVEQGLSLELIEALEKVSNEEGLQTIEVSFDWSSTVPQRQNEEALPEKVTFDQEIIESIPEIAERLQIHEKPQQVSIVGSVIALSRSTKDGEPEESGAVTVLGDVDGYVRKVVVELHGIEHDWAIRAYREHFPVIVSGVLVKRRSWRLEGEVSLDVESARLLSVTRRQLGDAKRSTTSEGSEVGDSPTPAPPSRPPRPAPTIPRESPRPLPPASSGDSVPQNADDEPDPFDEDR